MMFCSDCGADLDPIPVDEPCPSCGGARRSAVAFAQTAFGTATAYDAGVAVERADESRWDEKWQEVLRLRGEIRRAYVGEIRVGNAEVDALVDRFCKACHDMRDWLHHGHGVDSNELDAHRRGSPPLQVCSAVANTDKHHTRTGGMTARIRRTEIRPGGGAIVTIEVNWASPSAYDVDALNLANDCVRSWRDFFGKEGIDET